MPAARCQWWFHDCVAARLRRALTADGEGLIPALLVTDETRGEVYRLQAEQVTDAGGQARGLVLIEPASPSGATDSTEALIERGLTRREADVALGVLSGQTMAETAAALVVSPHTVSDYLSRVFEKLDVTSRQQLAVRLMGAA